METGTSGAGVLCRYRGAQQKKIKEYVCNQLQEDIASEQMCLKKFKAPFTNEPIGKGKQRAALLPGAALNKFAVGEPFMRLMMWLYQALIGPV